MRRTSVIPSPATVVVLVLVAASGCATAPSVDLPWNQSEETPTVQHSDTTPSSDAPAPETGPDAATYWAQKAVSASSQIAYAQHLRAAAERNPEQFARSEIDPPSPEMQPSGRGDARRGARRGAYASKADPMAPDQRSSTSDESDPADSESPHFRTVRRRETDTPSLQEADADTWPVALGHSFGSTDRSRTPLDPRLETDVYDLSDADARRIVDEKFGIELPDADGAVAIPGTFLRPDKFEEFRDNEFNGFDGISEKQKQNQVAIVVPGERIAIYAGERTIAEHEFETEANLPTELATVHPVRLIDDGTIQLLTYWPESDGDSEHIRYRAGILKVIGPFIGRLFERTVAERAEAGDQLRRKGYVDFLTSPENTYVRWIPTDGRGRPAVNRAKVLKWNRWEGVFREPKTPAAAPDQRS